MTEKPWGGVFKAATDRRVEDFTASVSFDRRLFRHDIAGSIAHAEMLAATGVIAGEECRQITTALREIESDIDAGRLTLRDDLEDIHMNIEAALVERIGDVGRKLHTGRSRNDQVATDFRLWIRDQIDELGTLLVELQRAFVGRADDDRGVILPCYTHLQRAQPVLANHYWLAYCEKFERDRLRLLDVRRRVNQLPLGTAAAAGTSVPIDREMVAQKLGFEGLMANSLDSSGDRDFALEFAFVLTMIALHLSGWAEEWILWSTQEFGFLELPQEFCTGSSIMPQKINPDVLELIRGKSARVVGNQQSLMVLLKGLPLAYNRDLQEDKQPIFDSTDTVQNCLRLAAPLVVGARLERDRIADRLDEGFLDATTFMEHLIQRGVPQRRAHQLVGELVALAMKQQVTLAELPLEAFQSIDASLDEQVYEVLGARRAVEAFASLGSTSPAHVEQQISLWQDRLRPSHANPSEAAS